VLTSILPAPKKASSQEIGRSRGGLTTKLHVVVDALGNPLRVILSAGPIADVHCASALIENLPTQAVVADKGYVRDCKPNIGRPPKLGIEKTTPDLRSLSEQRQLSSRSEC
jgi:hypothetical protein